MAIQKDMNRMYGLNNMSGRAIGLNDLCASNNLICDDRIVLVKDVKLAHGQILGIG